VTSHALVSGLRIFHDDEKKMPAESYVQFMSVLLQYGDIPHQSGPSFEDYMAKLFVEVNFHLFYFCSLLYIFLLFAGFHK
jgi:hypothetical protein